MNSQESYRKIIAIAMFRNMRTRTPIDNYFVVADTCQEIIGRFDATELEIVLEYDAAECYNSLTEQVVRFVKGFVPMLVTKFNELELSDKIKYLKGLFDYLNPLLVAEPTKRYKMDSLGWAYNNLYRKVLEKRTFAIY